MGFTTTREPGLKMQILVQKLRPGVEISALNKGLRCKWTRAPTLRSSFYSTASSLLKLLTGAGCLPDPPGTPLCQGAPVMESTGPRQVLAFRTGPEAGGWPGVNEFSSQRLCDRRVGSCSRNLNKRVFKSHFFVPFNAFFTLLTSLIERKMG